MTIVLPYPTPQGNNLADNDGGNGVNSPPQGAPEGNATSTVNDIQRYDKTCIKQNVENIDAINQALGTMAEQDASAVAITGGSISVQVDSAVNSDQLGGLTLQQLYDLTYPVNEAIVIRNIETPPPTWPGTASTWTLTAQGLFLKPIITGQPVGETFAGVTETDETILTEAQIPPHEHVMFTAETVSSGVAPGPTDRVATGLNVGGDSEYFMARGNLPTPARGATSSIGGGTGHTHTFDDSPPFQRVAAYLRTA